MKNDVIDDIDIDIDIWQYGNTDLVFKEKVMIHKWQKTLEDQPGVTGAMVKTLEMIITFSNDLMNGNGLEIPPWMTWMDGLSNN